MIGVPNRLMYLWKRRTNESQIFTAIRLTPEAGVQSMASEVRGYTNKNTQNVSVILKKINQF